MTDDTDRDAALRQELAEARKDSERLDWLEQGLLMQWVPAGHRVAADLRAATDAARNNANPPTT